MAQQLVSERIKIILETFAQGNKSALGRAAGVSGQAIADLIEGKKGGPSFPVLQKMLKNFPDIRAEWLIFGEGPMLKSEVTQLQNKVKPGPNNADSQKQTNQSEPRSIPPQDIDIMARVRNSDGTESIVWIQAKDLPGNPSNNNNSMGPGNTGFGPNDSKYR